MPAELGSNVTSDGCDGVFEGTMVARKWGTIATKTTRDGKSQVVGANKEIKMSQGQ